MIPVEQAAQELLDRRCAHDHLLPFVEYTHPNWISEPYHSEICDALEAVERRDSNRLMISAPPRHSKSEIASKRFPAWCMGRNPKLQAICCSYAAPLAEDFSADVRDLCRDYRYKNVFPSVRVHQNAAAASRWRTTKGGVYVAAGVGGSINGRGADIAIIDDPIKGRNEAESARIREVAWRWYIGDLYQRLMPGGAIVFMMTRWHEDDLAARALESEKWDQVCLPAIKAEYTDNEEALSERRYPLEVLQQKREVMKKSGRSRDWESQFQQNPTPATGSYCRAEWYDERYTDLTLPTNLNVYIASDYAVTRQEEGRDPDFTEHGVFGVAEDDRVYVLDWWFGQTDSDVWIEALLDLAKKWKPAGYIGEGGVIRKSIEPFLIRRMRERRIYMRCEWPNPGKDKAARARAFQARSAMGMVVFPSNKEWAQRVVDQCVGFDSVRYDDAFDVMSIFHSQIDEANSPITSPVDNKKIVDTYKRFSHNAHDDSSWKVA